MKANSFDSIDTLLLERGKILTMERITSLRISETIAELQVPDLGSGQTRCLAKTSLPAGITSMKWGSWFKQI